MEVRQEAGGYDLGLYARLTLAVQWARFGVAATLWLVLPALLGLRLVLRSEVK